MEGKSTYHVNRRRLVKKRLVAHHGGVCVDCKVKYPPYVMDFDHRDPSQKSFILASGATKAYKDALEETMKCDLVCSNCHRVRTHKQRCSGCEFCVDGWDGEPYGGTERARLEKKNCKCGKSIHPQSRSCSDCYVPTPRVDWPDNDELLEWVARSNMNQVAKALGCSFQAVKKKITKIQSCP